MTTKQSAVDVAEIRAAIARRNTTQELVALESGFSRTAFYRRMRGDVDFTTGELASVARTLGVPMSAFLQAEDVAA